MFPLSAKIRDAIKGSFQITGYPRSGTAWVASVLNTSPDILAYHESIIQNSFDYLDYDYVGDCSSEILFSGFDENPNNVKIVIARDLDECKSSMLECTLPTTEEQWNRIEEQFDERLAEANMVVLFDDLFNLKAIDTLFERIAPEAKEDHVKMLQLITMNVQLNTIDYTDSMVNFTNKYSNQL
jgi:hypothetical protein